jgi:hypothetical protein
MDLLVRRAGSTRDAINDCVTFKVTQRRSGDGLPDTVACPLDDVGSLSSGVRAGSAAAAYALGLTPQDHAWVAVAAGAFFFGTLAVGRGGIDGRLPRPLPVDHHTATYRSPRT